MSAACPSRTELGNWAGSWWMRGEERVKQSSFVGKLAGFLRENEVVNNNVITSHTSIRDWEIFTQNIFGDATKKEN